MTKLISHLSRLDWFVAVATLSFGLWSSNSWLIVAGAVSVAVAWLNPAKRFQARLFRSASARRASTATPQPDDACGEGQTAPAVQHAEEKKPERERGLPGRAAARSFAQRHFTYQPLRLDATASNRLTASSFNLHNDQPISGGFN